MGVRAMEMLTVTVGQLAAHCYVLWEDASNALVIDPGDEVGRIVSNLDEAGVTPALIVNTHGHFDHTGAVGGLVERYGCAYKAHADERPMLRAFSEQGSMFGMTVAPVPEPTGTIAHDEIIDVGGLSLRGIHTPGHTPGSLCLHAPSQSMVFTGDTLFRRSVGRSDFPGGNGTLLGASIRERLYCLPDETTVWPGHGPSTTIGEEKAENPFVPQDLPKKRAAEVQR